MRVAGTRERVARMIVANPDVAHLRMAFAVEQLTVDHSSAANACAHGKVQEVVNPNSRTPGVFAQGGRIHIGIEGDLWDAGCLAQSFDNGELLPCRFRRGGDAPGLNVDWPEAADAQRFDGVLREKACGPLNRFSRRASRELLMNKIMWTGADTADEVGATCFNRAQHVFSVSGQRCGKRDFGPGEKLGDRAILLGRFGMLLKCLLVDTWNLGFSDKVDGRDRPAFANLIQVHTRGGMDARRRQAGLRQLCRKCHGEASSMRGGQKLFRIGPFAIRHARFKGERSIEGSAAELHVAFAVGNFALPLCFRFSDGHCSILSIYFAQDDVQRADNGDNIRDRCADHHSGERLQVQERRRADANAIRLDGSVAHQEVT